MISGRESVQRVALAIPFIEQFCTVITLRASLVFHILASRLCDEAKPGQILISPRVLMKVENAVKVEPVGEFELKGIRRPLAAYNVLAAAAQ
jgi:hypothetical protein